MEDVLRLYWQLQPPDPVLRDGTYAVVATTYLNAIPNLTRSASPYAVIENVVVEESVRGTGLGKQIMAATLRAA